MLLLLLLFIIINIPKSSPSGSRRSSCSPPPAGRARGSGVGGSSPCWSLGQTSSGTGSYNINTTISIYSTYNQQAQHHKTKAIICQNLKQIHFA